MPKIFVQIASYRDPLLLSTIQQCIERSALPQNLTFGICQQDESFITDFNKDPRFTILNINHEDSQGACWARSLTGRMLRDEEFTLQIDSHMRFTKNWDAKLLDMWSSLNDPKAILTTYPGEFKPDQPEHEWQPNPLTIKVHSFDGALTKQHPNLANNWQYRFHPYRGVHIAGGFIFAHSSFIKDVPYDPELYFTGEETSLSVRAFTHGYNIYHPHRPILWHYYTRSEQPKHWKDNKKWVSLNEKATNRLKNLLEITNNQDLGIYGLGTTRTLQDYQNYSGIDFKRRMIHLDTIDGLEPPVDLSDTSKWNYNLQTYSDSVLWDYNTIDMSNDVDTWAFIFNDQNNKQLHRKDISISEDPEIFTGLQSSKKFSFPYYSPVRIPKTLTIWPYSKTTGDWRIPKEIYIA